MSADSLMRIAAHEASHSVAQCALGQGASLQLLSIRPASRYGGITCSAPSWTWTEADLERSVQERHLPLVRQSARLRRYVEFRAVVALAGSLGAELWQPTSGYAVPEPDEEIASRAVARLGPPTRTVLAEAETSSEPLDNDAIVAGKAAAILVDPEEYPFESSLYLDYLRAVTRRILVANWPAVATTAAELYSATVLPGSRVRTIYRKSKKF